MKQRFAALLRPGLESVQNVLARPMASFHILVTLMVVMTGFGLAMVLSASAVEGYSQQGSAYHLFAQQVMFAAAGLVLFYLALRTPVAAIRWLGRPALWFTVALLALVLVPGIGTVVGGARRWFQFGPISVQPSELVKVALCVWSANLLAQRRQHGASLRELLLPLIPVAALICLLIVLEPNLSTTITIAIIVGAVLWFAGLPLKTFGAFLLAGILIAGTLAMVEGYRAQRVLTFLGQDNDPQGTGYQARQALYALAGGGVFGLGFGQSKQKWNYLPNAHNDFIFAVIGEELGLVGAGLVILLFAAFAYVGFRIARRSVDPFLRLLASTITVLISAQAVINMAYVVGIAPVTGIQLPLLSAGGTSIFSTLVMFGLLANAARHEPEAIAALAAGGESRLGTFLRLSKPIAYRPSKAIELRDRLDERGRRRGDAADRRPKAEPRRGPYRRPAAPDRVGRRRTPAPDPVIRPVIPETYSSTPRARPPRYQPRSAPVYSRYSHTAYHQEGPRPQPRRSSGDTYRRDGYR